MTKNEIKLVLKSLSEDVENQKQNIDMFNAAQDVESMLNPDRDITDEFFNGLEI